MCDLTEEPARATSSAHCTYQHGTIECRGDGYLWDADSDGYDPEDYSWPCPECNTAQFLRARKDDAESVSDGESMAWRYTGESLWLDAVTHAREINPKAAEVALADIGFVDALRPSRNPEGFETVRYVYPPMSGAARAQRA